MLFREPAESIFRGTRQPLGFSADVRKRIEGLSTEIIVGHARHRRIGTQQVGTARHRRIDAQAGDEKTMDRVAILQLSCSFLPAPGTAIEWARYRVKLLPHPGDAKVIALDLSPTSVQEERELNLKLRFEPKVGFKFGDVSGDVSMGTAEWDVQRQRQIPSLTAAGLQSDTVYWQMESTPQHPLAGVRGFYVLLNLPSALASLTIESDVVADVVTPGGVFRGSTLQRKDESLRQVLWSD
jgi:hypothetical protein